MNTISEVEISYKPPVRVGKQEYIKSSTQADKVLRQVWSDDLEYREEMYVLMLNRANKMIGYNRISVGGTAGTIVDVKILFQLLLKTNTQSFILSHNHPSGKLKPSHQDIRLTKKVKEASEFLEINFLDHLIMTGVTSYSMADEGDM